MAQPEVTYSSLSNERNPFVQQQQQQQRIASPNVEDGATDTENEETPQNSGVMIHVAPESGKARWNHVEDLDSFFTRMYSYHQKHGFRVMMVQDCFSLFQFIFVVTCTVYMLHCIDYPVLFQEGHTVVYKNITIRDVVYPPARCLASLHGFTWMALILAGLFWLFRLIRVFYHFIQFWDIKLFFNNALKIEDDDLDNLTWHEVQRRVREVQSEQHMCIHKEQLTELDIYHRILRFKNYMVAMMNKNLIPAKMNVPLLGESVCMSRGLRYNIELILFWGPWSPFENNWHLREEFKRSHRRTELANKLSMQIMWLAVANFLLCPLVFLWQLMFLFFSYADLIKREPGTLGTRCWSQYGRLYLRHFNELDHELDARLTRAYRPACKYMSSFSSPLMAVIARNMVFFCGGLLSIIIMLTIYDEDVVQVEHILTIITLLTTIVVASRVFIPDENMIWCPEQLLTAVLAHVHYLPVAWRGLAHTSKVRDQFGQLFQLKATYLINELLSPVVTPFLLFFSLRPRALDLVDFFRNFTVSVVGVGDVCSFAQMDVRRHGNPDWQPAASAGDETSEGVDLSPNCETNQYTQGEHGKTELSLVHFTLTNPHWKMPAEARQFVQGIRRHAMNDLNRARGPFGGGGTAAGTLLNANAMGNSLMLVGSLGGDYSSIVQSILQTHNLGVSQAGMSTMFSFQNQAPAATVVHNQREGSTSAMEQAAHNYTRDFERMLQQNLTDGSTNFHLHNIAEDETPEHESRTMTSTIGSRWRNEGGQSTLGQAMNSMSMSFRGGINKREGPADGPREGLLSSLYDATGMNEPTPLEFTAADMCLSTLYLHELHHRQVRRRGVSIQQSQRHLWERPHQQQPDNMPSTTAATSASATTAGPSSTGGSIGLHHTAQSSSLAAERTPLLKKS